MPETELTFPTVPLKAIPRGHTGTFNPSRLIPGPIPCLIPMIALFDSFNRRTISRHRTLEAAVVAHRKHARAVRRANGPGAYIPVDFIDTTTGNRVDPTEARIEVDRIACH